jgi:lipoprotein-anchoring transpeptidase ErfK/SrfK
MRGHRPRRRRRRARLAGAALLAAVAAFAAGAVALRAPPSTPARPVTRLVPLPSPVAPAFVPDAPRRLAHSRHLAHWAPVRRSVAARTAPSPTAPVVASVATATPEGTRNLVAVLGRRQDPSGRPWVHVRLAVLPNGTTGWVPRAALGGYRAVRTRLDLDLDRLRATLYRDGQPVLRAPIAVGMAGWPTPKGRFYIRNKLVRYRSPAYGPIAFGTSARSARATDWPAGGFVGVHGTDRPDLVPGRVSHGCVRLRNAHIRALAARMPVGTPVTIH